MVDQRFHGRQEGYTSCAASISNTLEEFSAFHPRGVIGEYPYLRYKAFRQIPGSAKLHSKWLAHERTLSDEAESQRSCSMSSHVNGFIKV